MSGLFKAYRVLAFIVGTLLVVASVGSILKFGLDDGGTLDRLGTDLEVLWQPHGLIYMVYAVVAFVLSERAGWPLKRFALMMAGGLVPGLMFWVEHRVVRQLRAEHPELARS